MKRILLLSAVLMLTSCASGKLDQRINHVVFCWLKDSGNKVQIAQLIETSLKFRDIPGVLEVRAGEVIKSDRAIVESSYDVAILLTFKSMDDLRSYIEHEDHKLAVKTILKPLTSKIRVFDFKEKFKPWKEDR